MNTIKNEYQRSKNHRTVKRIPVFHIILHKIPWHPSRDHERPWFREQGICNIVEGNLNWYDHFIDWLDTSFDLGNVFLHLIVYTLYVSPVRHNLEYCFRIWRGYSLNNTPFTWCLWEKAIKFIDDPVLSSKLLLLAHSRAVSDLIFRLWLFPWI